MKKTNVSRSLVVGGAVLIAGLLAAPFQAQAQAIEDKLVIVTSYPKDLTSVFKKAFEKKYPGTKVEMLKKKTTAGIKYIQETAKNNRSDMFWASAPDAFEVLKGDGLLQKYQVKAKGIPKMVGAFPINDPDGYFKGFAASGYGIMWNTRYLKAKKLPVPKDWADLKKAVYHGHVGMSAPSRSGTTHLTVETIIQGKGWKKGWATMKEMGGNFAQVTERSFGVPDGVIQQVGGPAELYDRPANRFVAGFLGTANLIDGSVRKDGGKTLFRSAGGITVPLSGDVPEDGPCTILFRPQSLEIRGADEASPDGCIRLDGVVESEEFLGSRVRYTVKAGDATILVDANHQAGRPAHDVGAKVALYLTADQPRVLRR